MGEYWKPINITRREFIDPQRLSCGLKLSEWFYESSPVVRLMNAKWSRSDVVWAIGDEGARVQLVGADAPPPQDNLDLSDSVDISVPYCGVLPYENFPLLELWRASQRSP